MTNKPKVTPGAIGVAAVIGLLVVTGIIFSGIFRAPFAPSSHLVSANFERAPQLRKGDQVRLEGNVEGKVSKIESGPDAQQVRVTMKVDKSAGPVYADARARLGFKTLLGGVFYIDLDRGTPSAGPLGDKVIPLRNTTVQSEIEDVTDVVRGNAVKGLQTLPGQLATGLSDPAATASTLHTLSDVAPAATTGLTALRGAQPGVDLPEVVDAVAKTVKALDTGNDDIRTLVSGAAATVQVTGRRGQELRTTISTLPSVTYDLTHTFARLDRTLDIAHGLVDRLNPAAPDVAPTLAALRPTLSSTGSLLRSARPLTRTLPGTLSTLGTASRQLVPLVDDLKPSLQRLDATILPYLARKDPQTGKSTTVMIGGFAAGFGGSAGQQDGNGHFIRFPASLDTHSAYIPCRSSIVDADAASLLACDSFNTTVGNYLKYLPKIGTGSAAATGKAGR